MHFFDPIFRFEYARNKTKKKKILRSNHHHKFILENYSLNYAIFIKILFFIKTSISVIQHYKGTKIFLILNFLIII